MKPAIGLACAFVALASLGCAKHKKRLAESDPVSQQAQESKTRPDGFTDDAIWVGMCGAFQGPQAGLGTEAYRGVQAYFLEVNSQGGVNGRTLELVPLDDGYDKAKSVECTDKIISEQTPLALIQNTGTTTMVTMTERIATKYADKGYFVFGSNSGAEELRTGPHAKYTYNVRAGLIASARDLIAAFSQAGLTKFGVVVQDDDFGKASFEAAKAALGEKGLKAVADVTISKATRFDSSKLDAAVQTLKSAGVDAVLFAATYQIAATFTRDARESGWNVPVGNLAVADTAVRLLLAREQKTGKRIATGFLAAISSPPLSDTTLPAVRELHALLEKRNPLPPEQIRDANYRVLPVSSTAFDGFLTAKVFVEALRRAGRDLSRDKLRAAIQSIKDFDPGVDAKITYGQNDNQGFDRVWLVGIKDAELVSVVDMKKYVTGVADAAGAPWGPVKKSETAPIAGAASSQVTAAAAAPKTTKH